MIEEAKQKVELKRIEAAILQAQSMIANYQLQQEEFRMNIVRVQLQIDMQLAVISMNQEKMFNLKGEKTNG